MDEIWIDIVAKIVQCMYGENSPTSRITVNENSPTSRITENENSPTSRITENENSPRSRITENENSLTSIIMEYENRPMRTITVNDTLFSNNPENTKLK
ncbi:hypothetical protein AVEN_183785-1 [Araneus ventricosus]|uniref:Uncharacterized protein n=1 Tax=Araneus ventricosus TaxID=182803 RepID=A0A4Y2MS36_ARAVE|nr:hypothetical protein AVEN_183785-1 [Araneus ventricosus]